MNRKTIIVLIALGLLARQGLAEDMERDMEMPVAVDELLEVATPEPTEEPVRVITDEASIRLAQSRLIDMGLLQGKADGIFGPKSAAALAMFQAQNGLPANGILDVETMDALRRAPRGTALSIEDVQRRLIDLGYLRGTADGIWGSRSTAALKLFQRLHELEATGAINAETTAKLYADDVTALPKALSVGEKSDAVKALQARLIQFGFLDGTADGAYGQKTVAAVSAFQKHLIDQDLAQAFDIVANGEATSITQYILLNAGYSTYLRDVIPGETDGEALRVERRLVRLGYMDMAADDVLDDYAMEALELFVAKAGLGSNDTVNRAVIDALFSDTAPTADHCAPHDIAFGDEGLAVRAAEEALVRGGMTVKLPNGKYDGDLRKAVERLYGYLKSQKDPQAELFSDPEGLTKAAQLALQNGLLNYVTDVGGDNKKNPEETTRVQRRLHMLYYLEKSGIDGKYGSDSREAVKRFQAANGLVESGVADALTQARLFSDSAVPRPLPYRVEVSLARQQVEIYELNDQGSYDLVNSFTCSTGLNNSTPRGIFLDGFPVNRWHYFKKFNCWAQYSFDIEGDIMFHSVIYSSNNENSLRSNSLYALGNPASHGCIRLTVADARWLFEHCKRGSLVIVIY